MAIFADMLDVCSSGKDGEDKTFEEKSHDGGQQGLNGSLSGGNPNGGPAPLSLQSINSSSSSSAPAANLIPPQLQPTPKPSLLGNGELQICSPNTKRPLMGGKWEPRLFIILILDTADKEVAPLSMELWWVQPAGGRRTLDCSAGRPNSHQNLQ